MTDLDAATFGKAFQRLAGVFRLKLPPADFAELTRTYFQVLEAHPLEAVLAASARCLEQRHTFPKPAEWLAQIAPTPRRGSEAADRRTMSVDEAFDLARAAALGFEDQPCLCSACCRAGIDDRPVRFVPNDDGDGNVERALNPQTGKVETPGHWAHGDELAAWYAAREAFFALKLTGAERWARALALVGVREPGEEG